MVGLVEDLGMEGNTDSA